MVTKMSTRREFLRVSLIACAACSSCAMGFDSTPIASTEIAGAQITCTPIPLHPPPPSPTMLEARSLAQELLVSNGELAFDEKWYNHYSLVIHRLKAAGEEELFENLLIGATLENMGRIKKAIEDIDERSKNE